MDARTVHSILLARSNLEGRPPTNPFDDAWEPAQVVAGVRPNEIVIDVSFLNGTAPAGVRYAYQMARDCCNDGDPRIGKVLNSMFLVNGSWFDPPSLL